MGYFDFELTSNDAIKFVGGKSEKDAKETYQFQEVLEDMKDAQIVRIITYNAQFEKNNNLYNYLTSIDENADVKIILGVPKFTYKKEYDDNDIIKSINKFYENGYNGKIKLAFAPYNHSKIMGTENVLYIGSQNFSWGSRNNYEAGIILYDSSDIRNIYDRMFDEIWDRSIEYIDGDTMDFIRLLSRMENCESYLQSEIEKIDFGIYEDAQPSDYAMDIDMPIMKRMVDELDLLHDECEKVLSSREYDAEFYKIYGEMDIYRDNLNEFIEAIEELKVELSDANLENMIENEHKEHYGYVYPEHDDEIRKIILEQIENLKLKCMEKCNQIIGSISFESAIEKLVEYSKETVVKRVRNF